MTDDVAQCRHAKPLGVDVAAAPGGAGSEVVAAP
jgi:hypothetical protein